MSDKNENMPQRPKFWSELSADEKIERMREMIKNQGNEIRDLRGQLYAEKRRVTLHRHLDKDIVVPISEYHDNLDAPKEANGMLGFIGKNKDEVYF